MGLKSRRPEGLRSDGSPAASSLLDGSYCLTRPRRSSLRSTRLNATQTLQVKRVCSYLSLTIAALARRRRRRKRVKLMPEDAASLRGEIENFCNDSNNIPK